MARRGRKSATIRTRSLKICIAVSRGSVHARRARRLRDPVDCKTYPCNPMEKLKMSANELMIYSVQPPADKEKKTISVKFNNPVRKYWVQIEPAQWTGLESVPEQFRPIVDIALDNAAKAIFANYLKAFSTIPSTMPDHILAESEILDAASNDSSSWLSKDELEASWKASATRKRIIDN